MLARAKACDVEAVRDDAAVAAATARMFTPCTCYLDDPPPTITFTSYYSGFETVDRQARIVRDREGWALVVCPWSFDGGSQPAWVDTWTCPLDDAQRLHDVFSSGNWPDNVIDAGVDEICSDLRATGEAELIALAREIEALDA